jgi:predicted homoserine dehydrogenase-like protein
MLQQRAADGKPVRVGLIGAGKFGSMYLAQIPRTPGVHLVGIADLSPDGARANLARVGWQPARTRRTRWTPPSRTARPTSATTGRRWCATRRST